jgi:CheY-like chemotaxis protein
MECSSEYLRSCWFHEPTLEPGYYIWLEVSDTGCGMNAEVQRRIFEPFFTTKFTGRGLGLSAVLGIVRGHKGALQVESQLGKGTTFRLLFPAVQADAVLVRKESTQSDRWKGKGRVLLVDDEQDVRTLGQKMLERLGFEVAVAANGFEALEIYKQRPGQFVLVLLDLTMPYLNGEETFRELCQIDPEVKVILSSGYSESEVASRFAGERLAGFVQKPYSLQELRQRLREVLKDY